jgi:hypothetical protein
MLNAGFAVVATDYHGLVETTHRDRDYLGAISVSGAGGAIRVGPW